MDNGAAIQQTGEGDRLANGSSAGASSHKRSTLLWLGLGVTAVVLVACATGLIWQSERQIIHLQHAHAVSRVLESVLWDLEDVQDRQREYLVTEQPDHLESYHRARKTLDEEFNRLRQMAAANPKDRDQAQSLHSLVHQRLEELQSEVEGLNPADFEGRGGEPLMESIRQHIGVMEAEEQSALTGLSRAWQSRLKTSLGVLVGSALLAGCGLLLGQRVIARSALQRQQAQQRLEASIRRFQTLCEQAPMGIYETDAKGLCVYTNRRWSAMSGLSAAESLGHGWTKALHPDDRATVFEGWETTARHGATWEYRLLTPQGETRWIRAVGGPIYSTPGELTGYVGTIEDVTERRQSERELRESRQELRALAARLFRAQEEERKRIARELHDDLSQTVALLAFDTTSLVLAPPPAPGELKKSLSKLQARIRELSHDIRQIAHQLHPSILEDLGLAAALRELCEEFATRETIPVLFEHETLQEPLPVDVASCLYRVAQEALHNIQKHARASRVWITAGEEAEDVRLCVRDDGVGFGLGAGASTQGMGIVSMKERVRLLQGRFSIQSQPGEGTMLTVSIPLPRRHSEAHARTVSG
jgi:PAS domain S-box-containing protein